LRACGAGAGGGNRGRSLRKAVLEHYLKHRRDFPWRRTRDPYRIMVSEFMLQQTGTGRVREKYAAFIKRFPKLKSLSSASVAEVLAAWKGLGYNRRALRLLETAEIIEREYDGRVPRELDALLRLPGIGRATACAILVFSFNQPHAFLETNIRRVFLHFYFRGRGNVRDVRILPLVEATMDMINPRDWFAALMDYGAALSLKEPDPNRKSAHRRRQGPFEGSVRQARGKVLELLLSKGRATERVIARAAGRKPEEMRAILLRMTEEGFLEKRKGMFSLKT
jgi:A/G-specific adenine glycosylase